MYRPCRVYARKIHTLFLIALGAVFLSVTLRYSCKNSTCYHPQLALTQVSAS